MVGLFITLSCMSILGLIIYLCKRKRVITLKVKKRKPYPLENQNRAANHVTKQYTSLRVPCTAPDNSYLNYRFCPECHSDNEYGKQVIFKLGDNRYSCKVCGCKFDSFGNSLTS